MSNRNIYPWSAQHGYGFGYQQYQSWPPLMESPMIALQVQNQILHQKIRHLMFLLQKEQQSNNAHELLEEKKKLLSENDKKDQNIQHLQFLLQKEQQSNNVQELLDENKNLLSENAEKDNKITTLKLQILEMEAELGHLSCEIRGRDEKDAEMDNEITMLKLQISKLNVELNKLKSETDSNAEKGQITELKTQITELEFELGNLNFKIKDRDEKVKALNALNEVLGEGIEKRDETIVKYKKKLRNNVILNDDSPLDGFSPLPVSGNKSHNSSSTIGSLLPLLKAPQRRIGSKKLLALTMLGAENTTGPWICTTCGQDGLPMDIPSYPEFRQHLTDIHKVAIDAALCKKCGWRSRSDRELDFHMLEKHQVESLFYSFSKTAILKHFEEH